RACGLPAGGARTPPAPRSVRTAALPRGAPGAVARRGRLALPPRGAVAARRPARVRTGRVRPGRLRRDHAAAPCAAAAGRGPTDCPSLLTGPEPGVADAQRVRIEHRISTQLLLPFVVAQGLQRGLLQDQDGDDVEPGHQADADV